MKKELTFIGLGRMGLAMTTHLVEQDFTLHGFDLGEEAREEAQKCGVNPYSSISEAIEAQSPEDSKLVWMMVPSKNVDEVLEEVMSHLNAGDTIVDGGNSFFEDSLKRHQTCKENGFNFIDCGVSGGMEGARYGASVMAGGEADVIEKYRHVFEALATDNGFGHAGGAGAGHYVKMIHNGIEYGMMGALAEGLNAVEQNQEKFYINMSEVLNVYENGSIITSSLMSWLADAYRTESYLENIAGEVPKGETEFEMEYIVDHEETPVLQAALEQRKDTREKPSRIGTLISAMRNQFGGHKTIGNNEDT